MRAGIVALAAFAVSCSDSLPAAPEIVSIKPNQAPSDAPVPIEIQGTHLAARVVTDFDHRTKSELDATFTATLVRTDGNGSQAVALLDIQLTEDSTLTATVPAGLDRGEYDLTVVDPSRRSVTLAGAYRVVVSAEAVAGFRFDPIGPQRAHVPFTLSLAAVDPTGRVVDGFTGTVILSDRAGTLSPTSAGPFVLGHARVPVTVTFPAASNAITVQDALGHVSTSEGFVVKAGLPEALVFVSEMKATEAGSCSRPFTVEVHDVFGQPAQAEEPLLLTLSAGPLDAVHFFSDSSCTTATTSLSIAVGDSQASASFSTAQAGHPVLRVSGDRLPSVSQTQTVNPGPPSSLGFSTPARTVKAAGCSAAVTVASLDAFGNPSPVGSDLALAVSATPAAGVAFYADAACSTALGSTSIVAGTAGATFYFKRATSGPLRIEVTGAVGSGTQTVSQDETIEP